MKNKLRITNMIFSGRMPFKRKLKTEEGDKLVFRFNWQWINEEISPIISKRMKIRKIKKLNVHGKIKQPYVSIWCSGAINIVGVVNRKEANQVYDLVIKDLKKISRTLLK